MKRIELRVGQVVTAIKKRARCQFRRIFMIITRPSGLPDVVVYSTGGGRLHHCQPRAFKRWMRQQRKQKKRRAIPADLLSVLPGV